MALMNDWFYWALLSAVFAALTAIFAKIGLEGVDSDFATLIRTFVIITVLASFVSVTGNGLIRWHYGRGPYRFLLCPDVPRMPHGFVTFARCRFGEASKVAPVDKLSVVLVAIFAFVFLGERPIAREWRGILMVGAGVIVLGLKR